MISGPTPSASPMVMAIVDLPMRYLSIRSVAGRSRLSR
jgi:hypothetical protein